MQPQSLTERLPFAWHCFDLRAELPRAWQEQILSVAQTEAASRSLVPTSVTSREASAEMRIPVLTVGGARVSESLPWLYDLYRTRFRDLAQTVSDEPVSCAENVGYGVNLNVQRGTGMRYEAHVDSNPVEGLLYVTSHSEGAGGELVVANAGDVAGVEEIDADATRIYPVAGHLVFFDARAHSHYVAPLQGKDDVRVVAAMNFYTATSPESSRPADLDRHLFGVQEGTSDEKGNHE